MRIAVDHAVVVERHVPRAEHVVGERVALLERGVLEIGQALAIQPAHGQEAPGRQVRQHVRHMDRRLVAQHVAIERHVARLAPVVQLLAQALGQLLVDPGRVDRAVVAAIEAEDQPQLAKIGLDRALDARILQLAGQRPAVLRGRPVDLAERGGGRGVERELLEPALPARTKLGRHAPAHEGPAHGRRLRLQLGELGSIFLRQGIGDRGEQLGNLHQGALQPAQGALQLLGMLRLVDPDAEQLLAGDPCCQAAHGAGHLGIAHDPAGQAVLVAIAAELFAHAGPGSSCSS